MQYLISGLVQIMVRTTATTQLLSHIQVDISQNWLIDSHLLARLGYQLGEHEMWEKCKTG